MKNKTKCAASAHERAAKGSGLLYENSGRNLIRGLFILCLIFGVSASVFAATDEDGDGYYSDVDCDDSDPTVYPGATETCNNIDDDCDGTIDEDFPNLGEACTIGQGECEAFGTYVCTAAQDDTECNAEAGTPQSAELCDGLDNDCDGQTDEDLTQSTTCGLGACLGNTGTQTCVNGTWGSDTCNPFAGATIETCNNIDDDCDGQTDEDLTQSTTCGLGACSGNTGTQTCVNGILSSDTCDPFAGATIETCNNIDDDCDGQIDEDLTQPTTCGVGACSGNTGTETCTAGVWGGDTCDSFAGATAETCNNIDDDCDGSVDENLTQPTTCGVGACSGNTGTETCAAGDWGGDTCDPFTGATAETCNDIDDDCDGSVDDGLVQSTTCGVGIYSGNTGTETCTAGVWGGDTCDSLGWDPGMTSPLILLYDSEQHTATFEVSSQSMWKDGTPPGDSNLEILPSQSLSGSTGFDGSTTFKVPYASDVIESIVDFFGGSFDSEVTVGAALDAESDGHIGLRSELSNFGDGTVDIRYPEMVFFEYPTANTFWAGDNLQLGTDAIPSGNAYLRTTPPPVDFSLIFDLVLEETLSGRIDYGFDSSDFSDTIIDLDGNDMTILHLNEYEGWYSDTSAYPPPSHPEMPFTPTTGMICGEVDCVKFLTGSEGYLEMPYPKPTTNGVNAHGNLVASDTNVFGNAEIDLNHASKYGKALDVDTGEHGGFEFLYKILDADISLISKVKQNLEFSPTDYIRFDFSDQVIYGGSLTDSITTLAGSPVNVEFPPGRTDPITVTPTVLIENKFHNKYVHTDNNIFNVEVGTFSSSVPGVTLLSQKYSIPDLFGDWDWVCTERVCWNPCWPWGSCRRCDCVLGYWKPEMISVGPYTTPSFDIGPFGPTYTTSPSYDPKVTVVDQTFELSGFEEVLLPSFTLDPQVKPYPVPIPAGRDPYEVNEGSTIVLDGSESYDLDGDPIRLYWDLDDDGVFETEGSTPSYLGTDGPGVYTIWLMANDPYGYQVAETTVTVHNVAPTVDAGSDQTVNEGDTVSISGSFTDPGWLDTHTATIDWGYGTEVESETLTEENEYPNSTGTVTGSHAYGDNGDYTVTLTVIDDDEGVGTDRLTVTVNNVAPTARIDSMTQPNPQFILPIVHELAFDGSFTDPGWLDSHTSTWNFGDGTVVLGNLIEEKDYPDAEGTTTAEHIYSEPGTYTVTLTVTDDDGGVGTDTMPPVTVVDAETANQDLNDYIQGLDDDDFKDNADERKNDLANMLMAIDAMLAEEAYQGAIQDLRNNVRGKADGFVDGHLNNDWIIDPEAQEHICMKIDDLTAYLEHLKTLEG